MDHFMATLCSPLTSKFQRGAMMPQPLPTLLSLLLLVAVTSASSLVKRDVLGDLEDTVSCLKDFSLLNPSFR